MIDQTSPRYLLIDPRPIAANAPYTFFLPSPDELKAVAPGDFVKLMFEHAPPGVDCGVERMWVEVEGLDGGGMRGVLRNNPDEASDSIREGEQVSFQPHQVIAIHWSSPQSAPPPSSRREYWERCLVDDCVLDGREPVEFIYREEPDLNGDGDAYADSGWRIRGRAGGASDQEMEERRPRYVALGAVLNRDDTWLHLIDAPVGARFMRNFSTNAYVEERG